MNGKNHKEYIKNHDKTLNLYICHDFFRNLTFYRNASIKWPRICRFEPQAKSDVYRKYRKKHNFTKFSVKMRFFSSKHDQSGFDNLSKWVLEITNDAPF